MIQAKIRKMVHDDLRDVVHGDLITDPVWLSSFASDSSIWEQMPTAAVSPLDEADLLAVLSYAEEQKLHVHPRGAGLGVTGESLGRGIVLDLSQHFRRIIEINHDSVTVQAGTTLADLNAALNVSGRTIHGMPNDLGQMTVGGWLCGLRSSLTLTGSSAANQILGVKMMFADRSTAWLNSIRPDEIAQKSDGSGHFLTTLQRLINWRRDLFEERSSSSAIDQAGIHLSGVLDSTNGWIHPQLLVRGSRGSLGLILEAKLRTIHRKRWSAFVTIGFDLSERATDAAHLLPQINLLESAEVIDWRTAALVSEANASLGGFFPVPTPSTLVLRWDCDDEATAKSVIQDVIDQFGRSAVYLKTEAFSGPSHPLGQWRTSTRLALAQRPVSMLGRPVFEEIVVAPEKISGLLSQLAGASQAARLNASWVVSPLSGQIQAEPLFETNQSLDLEQVARWVHSVVEIVGSAGGVVRGVEPWIGRVRGSAIARQYADWISIWREIKAAFDTESRFNPHALPGESRPDFQARRLSIPTNLIPDRTEKSANRTTNEPDKSDESTIDRFPRLPVLDPELLWPESRGPQTAASACNACGACRSTDPALRMCPSFRGDHRESSTPRSLAMLVRHVTSGTLEPTLWGSEQLKEAAEACFHCQMCKTECQASIDISGLMIETKSAAVQNYGLSHKDFWLSRVDVLAKMSSYFPVIANAIMSHGQSRWVLEKITGLSRFRRLPRVRRWSFLHRADSRGWCRMRPQAPGPRVALFLDILANHFHQDLAETTVEYLKWSGVNVYIPYRQKSSGMPALVVGDLDRARELVRANLRVLGDAIRNGYTVVCIEPTSAMVLRDFYPRLTDDLDAQLVAENTFELSGYLAGMAERGMLPEARHQLSGRIGYHQPCHQRALKVGRPGLDLVRKLPGLSVDFIDRGCSGIAGPFGFSRSNFRKSLRIGHQLRARLKDDDIDVGMTECLSCRMQMEQGIPKRTHHPVEVLAIAAGLNPTLRSQWNHKKPRNLIT